MPSSKVNVAPCVSLWQADVHVVFTRDFVSASEIYRSNATMVVLPTIYDVDTKVRYVCANTRDNDSSILHIHLLLEDRWNSYSAAVVRRWLFDWVGPRIRSLTWYSNNFWGIAWINTWVEPTHRHIQFRFSNRVQPSIIRMILELPYILSND